MNRLLSLALLLAISLARSPKLHAQDVLKGMDLLSLCTLTNVHNQALCSMYLRGFAEGYVMSQEMAELGYSPVCMPAGVTGTQMILMFQKTAREHPEFLNEDAEVLVMKIFFDAYKCRPGERPKYPAKPN